jgi:hypothetical protein
MFYFSNSLRKARKPNEQAKRRTFQRAENQRRQIELSQTANLRVV